MASTSTPEGASSSNAGIILTQDGVIVIDTGQNPYESRNVWATVRNLTSMPVRFVINTEPHGDHTTGNFMFSPPAVVVGGRGRGRLDARRREATRRIASSGSPRHLPSSERPSKATGSSRRTSSTRTR